MLYKGKSHDMLVILVLSQLFLCALVLFDIPLVRMIFGFVFLTFVPGFLILKLLKADSLDRLETLLLAVGLSLAFLMIVGLVMNEICLLCGFLDPLSLLPLMIVLNGLILLLGVLVRLRGGSLRLLWGQTLKSRVSELLPIVIPIISIAGAAWGIAFRHSLILLFMMVAIALLFAIVVALRRMLSPRIYAFPVLMISCSLLLHSALVSEYLVTFGSDVSIEFFVFEATKRNAQWSPTVADPWSLLYLRLNSMLSVTILPTIYSTLLNMEGALVLRLLYPLIFSLVPLVLYSLWKKRVGGKYAFASAFFFMSQMTFFGEMLGLTRQMIAELFFALLLLVIFNKKLSRLNRILFFMVFSFALVASHYALAEIFLVFVSLALVFLVLMKQASERITVTMVVFFFILTFSWYLYTSSSAVFDSVVSYGSYVVDQFGQFFDPQSRGQTVLRGLGLESSPSVWSLASRMFAYVTEIFIALGFIGLITRRVNARARFEKELIGLSVIAMTFLAALIVVPALAETMNMTRFYHVLLFFLAPLCILGVDFLANFAVKQKKHLIPTLLLVVLVPYFLFQTGFVYEVTGSESWSLPLSRHRMEGHKLYYGLGYIDGWSFSAAKWMKTNVDVQRTQVYADLSSINELTIYGSIYEGEISWLSNTTEVPINGTIYLSPLNTVDKIVVSRYYLFSLDELSLDEMSKVYTNGKGEIFAG